MRLEEKLARKLIHSRKTLSIAESCTGGLLAHRLTNVPGSSAYFLGGVTAYANRIKMTLLKVPSSVIKKHGSVSAQTAVKMAEGIRKIFRSDYGIAITGIAGPAKDDTKKPVGLVHIAVCSPQKISHKKLLLKGTRLSIKAQAASHALRMILKILK